MEIPIAVVLGAVGAVWGATGTILGVVWRRYTRVQDRAARMEQAHREELLATHARHAAQQADLIERYHELCVGQAGMTETILDRARIVEELVAKRRPRPRREET